MGVSAFRQAVAMDLGKRPEVDIRSVSAEEFIEGADYCDLPISPAQRALIRAADGLPVTHLDPFEQEYHLGTREPFIPPRKPEVLAVRAGRRSGKSLIVTLLLARHALRAVLRRKPLEGERAERDGLVGVGEGERVRLAVVAARMGQSLGTFQLALSRLARSPKLAKYISNITATTAKLRRDDGQVVDVEILAAASRGNNLRSGWFIGAVLDESDFFGEKDASVTLQQQIDAVFPALVTDGQIACATSPWDDTGQFAEMHAEAFGKPGEVVAFHSSTQKMNPTYPVEKIERKRRKDPDFVAREYDAIPMSVGGDQFFPEASIIAACTRQQEQLPPNGAPHWAGCDPGLRKNSAALALARCTDGKAELAFYEELIPKVKSPEQILEDKKKGIPPGLSPSVVFRGFARTSLNYRAEKVQGDQYYEDDAIEQMPKEKNDMGESVWYDTIVDNADSTATLFTKFRSMLNEGNAILPFVPELMEQMRKTKSRRGQNGKVLVALPRSGSNHADVLKAVVLAMVQVPLDLVVEREPPPRHHDEMRFGGGRGF